MFNHYYIQHEVEYRKQQLYETKGVAIRNKKANHTSLFSKLLTMIKASSHRKNDCCACACS
jgi:hypothetical protein